MDAGGNVKLTESYEPYGSVLTSQGSATSAFGFTGEQFDSYTQLLFLRARYMQPGLGMFLSRDPWSGDALRPGSMNGWNYVEGNPIDRVDPSGLCAIAGATDCERFVSEVRCLIEGLRDARACYPWLRLDTEEVQVLDLLAWYYSGIPFTGLGLGWIPRESTFRPGVPDRWGVPIWQGGGFEWDHPINQPGSEVGQAMRQSYGFKRPCLAQTHHYFAFLKFAYHWGGPPVEWMHRELEIRDQLKPAFELWQQPNNRDAPDHIQRYAWVYRESVHDLYIVREATQLATLISVFGTDIIPLKLKTWCASSEADVWSLESGVDQFYFSFPRKYWPDERYWPRR